MLTIGGFGVKARNERDYETIFSVPTTYSYTADDVLVLTNDIHDDVVWK